jgi:hypothetical protein
VDELCGADEKQLRALLDKHRFSQALGRRV